MRLVGAENIDPVLEELDGYRFTTAEFIVRFGKRYPEVLRETVDTYGAGGTGSGSNYSANVHIAKSISARAEEGIVTFVEYIRAPRDWGNRVIALWECRRNSADTVRVGSSVEDDISEVMRRNLKETENALLVATRIGQGRFRRDLVAYWKACAVTGCGEINLLVASHIKPWAVSSDRERLDPFNGLILVPNLDRLFDKGLITFSDRGEMKVSSLLSGKARHFFGVDEKASIRLDARHKLYLAYHWEYVFESKS
jgi:hypothetical protein